jgi:hypothetical protein
MLLNKFKKTYTRRNTGIKNRIGVTLKHHGLGSSKESRARIIIKSSHVGRKQIKIWPVESSGGVFAAQ